MEIMLSVNLTFFVAKEFGEFQMGKGWRDAISVLSRGLQTESQIETFLQIKQESFSALQRIRFQLHASLPSHSLS